MAELAAILTAGALSSAEFAGAVGTSAALGGAETLAAGATAGAAGAGILGSGISAATAVSTLAAGSGIFATLAGLSASATKSEGLRAQADEAEAEARQESNQTLDRQRRIRAAALKAMGESDVSFAASGIDLGYGDAAQNRGDISDAAQSDIKIDREGAAATAAQYLRRAAIYRRMASVTQNTGWLSAAAQLAETGYKSLRR